MFSHDNDVVKRFLWFNLILFMQAAKFRAIAKDNLLDRIGKGQSGTRLLLRRAVSVMSRASASASASMRGVLSPTVVVEHKISGIESHDDYSELRGASLDVEAIFLTRLQETLQMNLESIRNDMRNPFMEFFEEDTLDPKLNHVKFHVFGKPAGGAILESSHPTMRACFAQTFPWVKGTLLPFVSSSFRHSDITALIRQECLRDGLYLRPSLSMLKIMLRCKNLARRNWPAC